MKTIDQKRFCLSIVSFLLSSATIWLMPVASFGQEGTNVFAFLLAAAFWLFLILGVVFQRLISRRRKRGGEDTQGGIAFLRFFSNRPSRVFDVLLIAGAVVLILAFFFPALPGWVTRAAIFTLVFSLEMHVIFTGRNYSCLYKARADSMNMADEGVFENSQSDQ